MEISYKKFNENIYLDGLYFKYLRSVDQCKTQQAIDMTKIKAYQDINFLESFCDNIFDEKRLSWVKQKEFTHIAIIPNNVIRKVSINEFVWEHIKKKLDLNEIKIYTKTFDNRMPQKSLKTLWDRIYNANNLFSVDFENLKNKKMNVLLIDDVCGSGATMNTISKLIKKQYSNSKVVWFSFLWSYDKWFDIINEV